MSTIIGGPYTQLYQRRREEALRRYFGGRSPLDVILDELAQIYDNQANHDPGDEDRT